MYKCTCSISSFLSIRLKNWLICFPGRLYCNATFDGWGCWNYTLAGTRAYIQCPAFKEGFDTRCKAHFLIYLNCVLLPPQTDMILLSSGELCRDRGRRY